jgi:hypothetical protein
LTEFVQVFDRDKKETQQEQKKHDASMGSGHCGDPDAGSARQQFSSGSVASPVLALRCCRICSRNTSIGARLPSAVS